MGISDIVTLIGIIVGGNGVVELVKWWFSRKASGKILTEEGEQAEIATDSSQFHYLQERLIFAEQQNLAKEQRFAEQTNLLRETNSQLLSETIENGKLKAEIAALKAERKLKLCEVPCCGTREPQSGY